MKPGRNDPCPCGSGKKYKHCCLDPVKNTFTGPSDVTWRRLRLLLDGYPVKMGRFVSETYGPTAVFEAWREFADSEDIELDMGRPLMQVFMPWFFHCWSPDPEDTEVEDESLHDVIPTAAYLAAKGRRLDPLFRRYLESLLTEPLTFFEVLEAIPGRQMTLREVMSGEERVVTERSASQQARRGDLLFAQLASVDHLNMIEANGAIIISPMEKARIIDMRTFIAAGNPKITHDVLRSYDFELIGLFHEIADRANNPQTPQLQNTDGEPLSPRTLVYDLKVPPAEAFNALKHLSYCVSEEAILSDAHRDTTGELTQVCFQWHTAGNAIHPEWDNTRMGEININGKRLTGEVNSEARADALRQHIETALGAGVRYRACEIRSMEQMLAEARASPSANQNEIRAESERLAELPEVRAEVARMMAAHWERWIDLPIPMLDGRTPREAVKDRDGREIVESLVIQGERAGRSMKPPTDEAVFRRVRERLGLL